jgi:hypothetical protein
VRYTFRLLPRRLAVALAFVVSTPLAAFAAPTVQFLLPNEGGALWGNVQGPPNCIVTGTNISRVLFYLNDAWINTDGNLSNGLGCWVDTRKYADGTYTLKAVAYDSAGRTATATRAIVIRNAGTPTVTSGIPAIVFEEPAAGGALSGNVQGPPHCIVSGYNVSRVLFYLNNAWVNTDGNLLNGLGCWIDTRKYADGSYTLKAVAYSSTNRTTTLQRAIQIRNSVGIPEAGNAIPTFESLGLYWNPPSNPGAAGCEVRYRKAGETAWKPGLPMWYDARNSECRGSLVHLTPGTSYEVQFAMAGQQPAGQLTARTWSEDFPIARTVALQSGSQQLNITEGGTASGYVLYTGAPGTTLDVANGADYNILISAPYVIVRGLTLKGARIDAIKLVQGARDVVIEDNDISGWGRDSGTVTAEGWKVGVDQDSGIKASCTTGPWLVRTIVQRNHIHHPRYGSNSWSEGHPKGPNAIYFHNCGGNHVFRHNEIYSEVGRYFMDAYGGAENFSNLGMPNSDSDINGNRISHAWDDGIEAEGANRNVRIWGNYTDQTGPAIATTATSVGPVYIFRNVQNRVRLYSQGDPDADLEDIGRAFAKAGSASDAGNGRRYVFHNTVLQAPPPAGFTQLSGAGIGLKGNANQPLTNTVSRNNIWHIRKAYLDAINERAGAWGNDLDYDLFNGNVIAYSGAEANGIVGTPIYEAGHGWENEDGGLYQLAPISAGYDRGVYLPNFNEGFAGAAPDIGAHEAGTPAMVFGAPAH